MRSAYPPSPCVEVSPPGAQAGGFAVLKDRKGRFQYLVIPLDRIVGIESPLLQQDAPNYLADAWTAGMYVQAALHRRLPRDALSLVVNSAHDRTQDQLHIHIDCVRPDVHAALQRLLPGITDRWQPLGEPLPPQGGRYQVRWASGENIALNAFTSLAASLPAGDRMSLHSLAVFGARRRSGEAGFILLSSRYDPEQGERGNAEKLQDRVCAIADKAEAPGASIIRRKE